MDMRFLESHFGAVVYTVVPRCCQRVVSMHQGWKNLGFEIFCRFWKFCLVLKVFKGFFYVLVYNENGTQILRPR